MEENEKIDMNKDPNDKKFQLVHHSWWIGGLIGFLVIFRSDFNELETPLWSYVIIGIICGLAIGLLIDSNGESITAENKTNLSNVQDDGKVDSDDVNASLSEYADAKSKFQYFSDDALINKFRVYEQEKKSELLMTRLALEEELVRRRLIDHSPIHAKLEKIQSRFKI